MAENRRSLAATGCVSSNAGDCELSQSAPRRLVIGISGASGVVYGVRLLELGRELELETHLVMTKSAKIATAHESSTKVKDIEALASVVHSADDIAASISSGSC